MRLHLRTTSPRKHSADGCEVRREPRPLKEERKCLSVAEQEKLVKVGRGAAGGVAERRGTPCRHKAAAIFGGSPGTCWEPGGRRACGGAAAGRPWPPGNRISSRCPFCRGSSMSAEVPEAASAEEQKVSARGARKAPSRPGRGSGLAGGGRPLVRGVGCASAPRLWTRDAPGSAVRSLSCN